MYHNVVNILNGTAGGPVFSYRAMLVWEYLTEISKAFLKKTSSNWQHAVWCSNTWIYCSASMVPLQIPHDIRTDASPNHHLNCVLKTGRMVPLLLKPEKECKEFSVFHVSSVHFEGAQSQRRWWRFFSERQCLMFVLSSLITIANTLIKCFLGLSPQHPLLHLPPARQMFTRTLMSHDIKTTRLTL